MLQSYNFAKFTLNRETPPMKNLLRSALIALISFAAVPNITHARDILLVRETSFDVIPDSTAMLQRMIDEAAARSKSTNERQSTLTLPLGEYHIFRQSASKHIYHISNSTSESDNPDQTKHIGLWLRGIKNLTIDGGGSTIVTHGEMTSFVIDSCENITFRNLTFQSYDPTVPEMTVTAVGEQSFDAVVNPMSQYSIRKGKLRWVGEGWSFLDGIAQIYDPTEDITWRSWSPLAQASLVTEISQNRLHFDFGYKPDVKVGQTFQMRDGIRDEVGGFVNRSRNVTFERFTSHNLNNFGILSQFSENISYISCSFVPEPGSGRTNSAAADMLHFSGCKGKILIENSRFSGAHDDPINVHGTHLAVTERISPTQLKLRFMHGQTFGFEAFYKGDGVEVVDPHTLQAVMSAKITEARLINPREMVVTLSSPLNAEASELKDLVLENVSWTPNVEIRGNYFTRMPTRGILVSTRGVVRIYDNTFYKTGMSAILIADDAQSWFESGPVRDVSIYRNNFIQCAAPVIYIAPENEINYGAVHRNISITGNRFETRTTDLLRAKSVDGLTFKDNLIIHIVSGEEVPLPIEKFTHVVWSNNVVIKDNTITNKREGRPSVPLQSPLIGEGFINTDTPSK